MERNIEPEEEIKILRELLWLHHGHGQDVQYGDDGEMQCVQCEKEYGFWDWKRTPVNEIRDKIMSRNPKLNKGST